jgi:hypothetical protein
MRSICDTNPLTPLLQLLKVRAFCLPGQLAQSCLDGAVSNLIIFIQKRCSGGASFETDSYSIDKIWNSKRRADTGSFH